MGLGGYLTWTAVARELVHFSGVKKVFPFEQHGNLIKPIKSPMFENNPFILQDFGENILSIPMQLNDPRTNYCKKDLPEKAVHRYDRHIIEQICEFYGIQNPTLKCELYFSAAEELHMDSILGTYELRDNDFIVIEPQSNNEYTINKLYPLDKWQMVVDNLTTHGYKVVQVGKENNSMVLNNVIDLTGQTSFREASLVIKSSKLFVSSEGGLMHAANAMSTPAVIVYTGFIHPKMTGYKDNTNIWIGKDHGPCGMKVPCPACSAEAANHNVGEIINAVIKRLR